MNLTKELFSKYFSNNITQEELYESIGINYIGFDQYLLNMMVQTYEKEDGEMIEYLIYTLYLGEDIIKLSIFLDILDSLILCRWHNKHEDIVLLLQKINSPQSVNYLYEAISLKPNYLEWDDNYAFETKCIHAIARCNNQNSLDKLMMLAADENDIIKTCTERQIKKIRLI